MTRCRGAVIHIVPRLLGPKPAGCFRRCFGAALIAVASGGTRQAGWGGGGIRYVWRPERVDDSGRCGADAGTQTKMSGNEADR